MVYLALHVCRLNRVKSYIDDIIVSGITWEECRDNLNTTLIRLQEYNVKVQFENANSSKLKLNTWVLGINEDGTKPKQNKVRAIADAPSPTDVTSLKSYIGLLNFYGYFIRNLSSRLMTCVEKVI